MQTESRPANNESSRIKGRAQAAVKGERVYTCGMNCASAGRSDTRIGRGRVARGRVGRPAKQRSQKE